MDEVEKLIRDLKSEDVDVRKNAAEALVRIGKPALPALVIALEDENQLVRLHAAEALGRIGNALLRSGTSQQSHNCREFCNTAVPALVIALRDEFWWVRLNAVEALVIIADAFLRSRALRQSKNFLEFSNIAVPTLVEALGDGDWRVRCSAAEALWKVKDASAVPALVEALGDRNANVRCSAAEALVMLGKPGVTALVEVLEDVRVGAAAALCTIPHKHGTVESLEFFEKTLKEFFEVMKKKLPGKNDRNTINMQLAKLMKEVAKRKNDLASKREVLLTDKPKPPKRGKIYQAARRVQRV